MANNQERNNPGTARPAGGRLALRCAAVVAVVLLLAAALAAVCSLNTGQPLPFAAYFS